MASKTEPEFRKQFHVKHQNNPMFPDGLSGQNEAEKDNSYVLSLKHDKNIAFCDTISRFYCLHDVDQHVQKLQLNITRNG